MLLRHAFLRVFRGVHKANLRLYVATYEALLNAKQVTAALIPRMCFGDLSAHTTTHNHSNYVSGGELVVSSSTSIGSRLLFAGPLTTRP
jgi:hypothetical protein